jgi:5-oxoprolinase (ATP-hydrolysing) subunit A
MFMDINCDMGESFGRYTLGNDAALMPLITSANIACGLHAGDALVMHKTIRLAKSSGVAVGAHPGYPDLQGFGRRSMEMSPEEVEALVLYQLGALAGFARAEKVELVHVKPHGALYNQAARDRSLARAIARAVAGFSMELILVGLAGSQLVAAGEEVGLKTASEGFPERGYMPDGSLMPRKMPGAVLDSPAEAAAQALRLAREGIEAITGRVKVDTLCIHGDNPGALEIAGAVRQALLASGVEIKSL